MSATGYRITAMLSSLLREVTGWKRNVMKRHLFAAACLIGIALAAGAKVQVADDTVLLRYRFTPGKEFRYRMTMNGDMGTTSGGMTPPPGVAMLRKVPSTVTGSYELVEKVTSGSSPLPPSGPRS
jgi:hypothetical protein